MRQGGRRAAARHSGFDVAGSDRANMALPPHRAPKAKPGVLWARAAAWIGCELWHRCHCSASGCLSNRADASAARPSQLPLVCSSRMRFPSPRDTAHGISNSSAGPTTTDGGTGIGNGAWAGATEGSAKVSARSVCASGITRRRPRAPLHAGRWQRSRPRDPVHRSIARMAHTSETRAPRRSCTAAVCRVLRTLKRRGPPPRGRSARWQPAVLRSLKPQSIPSGMWSEKRRSR